MRAQGGSSGLGAALGLLGDEWSLLVVRTHLLGGTQRFVDLQRSLGIGPTVLADRLAALVAGGVLEPADPGYRLTRSGRSLWRLLLCVWGWEQEWVQGAALPAMRHAVCGQVFRPVLACDCGAEVGADDVELRLTGDVARCLPSGARRRRTSAVRPAGPGLFPETMALLGSRWSSALLGACFLGAQRFSAFAEVLGAPPGVLADRLRDFVARGVLTPDYALTAKGRAFFPTVVQLAAWGERWHPAPDGPALVATHRDHGFAPRLRCSACAGRLRGRDVRVEPAA